MWPVSGTSATKWFTEVPNLFFVTPLHRRKDGSSLNPSLGSLPPRWLGLFFFFFCFCFFFFFFFLISFFNSLSDPFPIFLRVKRFASQAGRGKTFPFQRWSSFFSFSAPYSRSTTSPLSLPAPFRVPFPLSLGRAESLGG